MLRRFDRYVKYLTLVLTLVHERFGIAAFSTALDLALEDLERLAHLADGIVDARGARAPRLVRHEHAQPEVDDGCGHGVGGQVAAGVKPPRAPVAHADDREG